jgi:hypothetical protein
MNQTTNEHGLNFQIDAGQPASLTLDSLTGDLEIAGWDQPVIQISAADDEEQEDLGEILNIQQSGNNVTLNLNLPVRHRHGGHWEVDSANLAENWNNMGRMLRRIGRSVAMDLRVRVPRRCDITIRTASGDVRIAGVQGKIFLQSASGDVTLTEVEGSALVKSASADVTVEKLRGRLGVRSMSGDLTVRDSDLIALSVGTVSGDLHAQAALRPGGEYEIQSVSGDVLLSLPAERRATVDFVSVSGDIKCRLPAQVEKLERKRRRIQVNGGGETQIRVHTTSGDAVIQGGAEWYGSPMPATASAEPSDAGDETRRFSPEETEAARAAVQGGETFRMQGGVPAGGESEGHTQRLDAQAEKGAQKSPELVILEAIESGEMSVDEGLRRLNELAQ